MFLSGSLTCHSLPAWDVSFLVDAGGFALSTVEAPVPRPWRPVAAP